MRYLTMLMLPLLAACPPAEDYGDGMPNGPDPDKLVMLAIAVCVPALLTLAVSAARRVRA